MRKQPQPEQALGSNLNVAHASPKQATSIGTGQNDLWDGKQHPGVQTDLQEYQVTFGVTETMALNAS